ncbi:hypothetical protein [Streptomyces sp. YIM S03343]
MEQTQKSRAKFSFSWNGKIFILSLAVIGLFCAGGWLFENKGLYLLPSKMCDGILGRDTVKQVLPGARSADSGSGSRGVGAGLNLRCHVTTSGDSSLSGRASVQRLSRDGWLEYYRSVESKRIIRVSVGGIEALARIDSGENTASVYVPCSPPAVPEYSASRPYAVVGEAWVSGSAKANGIPLRQTLTDFAYRLSERAYKLAECKAPRDFPKELPRYKDS